MGITGQDGSYLAELLLEKEYEVFGFIRRSSVPTDHRISRLLDCITLVEDDLSDTSSVFSAMEESKPDEIYSLAAQSFVGTSWSQPLFTSDCTGLGVTRLPEAVRYVNPRAKFYQASSSEMCGKTKTIPQTEETPFYPCSPYGVAGKAR